MDPFWPTLGALNFLPGVKKGYFKISQNLELKEGKKILKVLSADFFYICSCLKDGIAKKPIAISIKK